MAQQLPYHIGYPLKRFPSHKVMPIINHVSTSTARGLKMVDSGSIISNVNAAGTVTFTLPSVATGGQIFHAHVLENQSLRIDPGNDAHQVVLNGTAQTAGKYVEANAAGESIDIYWHPIKRMWVTVNEEGTWTAEA